MAKTTQLQIRVSPKDKASLRRRARRAGMDLSAYVLAQCLPPEPGRFAALVAALEGPEYRCALAELSDLLHTITPLEFGSLEAPDLGRLLPWLQNYLTAMVEMTAARLRLPPPDWSRQVAPLDHPWFATELPGLRAWLLAQSPAVFKRRNLFADSSVGDRV